MPEPSGFAFTTYYDERKNVLINEVRVAADGNFSQRPGFAEYFAAHPPADAAGPADRALARQRCATA